MYKKRYDTLRNRESVSLSKAIDDYFGDLLFKRAHQTGEGGGAGHSKADLRHVWRNIASEAALAHTDNVVYDKRSATKGRDCAIIVFTDDSSWAAELSMQKEHYRMMFEREMKKPVSEVKFFTSRNTALRKEGANANRRGQR
jgi:hypothetical protein